jgi:hypothetical protein
MRNKIDQDYIEAVRKAADVLGGQSVLARHAGINPATICALLNPKNERKFIHSSIYNRLYPFVSPYLPEPPEIPIGPALPPQIPVMPANPFYNNTINNNITAPGAVVPAPAPTSAPVTPSAPVDLTPGAIPAEVILHAMQGMEPEEKARFLKELYTSCSHETEESPEE